MAITTDPELENQTVITADQHPSQNATDTIISVRNVSKMYPLYQDPRDRLKQSLWYALPKFLRRKPHQFYKEFWALRDISFELKQGEALGIVGRNGSGKSTLLQIIAGTLAPSWGEIAVKGKVAALLQLSSGFSPEFTGRENIYMNGAIWGMTQNEIDALYDDIVDFADIGQFIDQPVKLYSSGMALRLAFAVQAFVPKQTLIVDEALAVGDAAFQHKCMAVLERFQEMGGTFVLVSHTTQTIIKHCQRCLLLSQGELLADGPSKPITDLYEKLMFTPHAEAHKLIGKIRQEGWEQALTHSSNKQVESSKSQTKSTNSTVDELSEPDSADYFDRNMPKPDEVVYGSGDAEIFDYGMYNTQGKQVNVLVQGKTYQWRYRVKFHTTAEQVSFGFTLKTVDGLDVAGTNSILEQQPINAISSKSVVEVVFEFKLNLAPGIYFLTSGVSSLAISDENRRLARHVDMCSIRVISKDSRGTHALAYLEPTFSYFMLN